MKNKLLFCVGVLFILSVSIAAQPKPVSPTSYRVDDYDWNSAQASKQPMVTYTYNEEKLTSEIETPILQFFDEKESENSSPAYPCAPGPPGPVLMCWFQYKTEGRIVPNVNGGKAHKQPQYITFYVNRYDTVGVNKDGKVELRFGKSKLNLQGTGKYASSLVVQLTPQTFIQISKAKSLSIIIDKESRSFEISGNYRKPLRDLANTLPQPTMKPPAKPISKPSVLQRSKGSKK